METTTPIVLISTGNIEAKLDRLENSFRSNIEPHYSLETIRLGNVKSLSQAYHQAAISVNNKDAILIFCHQDVFMLTPDEIIAFAKQKGIPYWLKRRLEAPFNWIDIMLNLISKPETGLVGIVGATGLLPEMAWWQYPDLSGTVFHSLPEGKIQINPYGLWGKVAVLDGLCLIVKRETYDFIGAPTPQVKGFHFYDMDISLRSIAAGLNNWTIPLFLWHESTGADIMDENWKYDQRSFLEAWSEVLPLKIPFVELPFI
ncbi:MAG: glycosyltransferase [Candidatus Electryonea clarkiae]|nr:glycosyltransferase [Candidatus Electryonea clarkiae]MDP8288077.1 glycosyltransferase [Candidatus Electryonea clarkiae]